MPLSRNFTIKTLAADIGWPRGYCADRGDLGCLVKHAKSSGYRAGSFAEILCVEPRMLRRIFRDSFGMSLKNWLVHVRAVEVRHRLRGTESIKEIARGVGFAHSKELSREFFKVYLLTPTEYRLRERLASKADGELND